MTGCRGICSRYKPVGPPAGGRYKNGQKRCQHCDTYLMWEGLWCPCCGSRLRTKPRNIKYKAKFRAAMEKTS